MGSNPTLSAGHLTQVRFRVPTGGITGSNPTLSADYKIPPRKRKLHLLPDLIVLVVNLSKLSGPRAKWE